MPTSLPIDSQGIGANGTLNISELDEASVDHRAAVMKLTIAIGRRLV